MADRRGCVNVFVIHTYYKGGIKIKNVYLCMLINDKGSKIKNG